ncbi:MAG: xanthine dehydrogenase family protein molybdopterin-binding subunit [bacterium]|nr:xanthine dehydrogenase family protein molybdopterin-binding subunit [bacterium]
MLKISWFTFLRPDRKITPLSLLTRSMIPTIMDIPEIEVIIVSDADDLISSVGAKGCGEPAHIPTAAAIANAVYNAVGVRIKSLPITPDKVLTALQKG